MSSSQNSDQQITVKVFPSAERLKTDLQSARNNLAIAIKNCADDQTDENKNIMLAAQREVTRLEQEYRDAKQLLYENLSHRMQKGSIRR